MQFPKEWNVFPLPKDKKAPPLLKKWEQTRYPREKLGDNEGNYALGTGLISGGIVVFDWDFRRGLNRKEKGMKVVYDAFKESHPKLAKTLIAETPHGYHFYYVLKDGELGNTSLENGRYKNKEFHGKNTVKFGKYLQGLDTRANGGYVVVPPSIVDEKKYQWRSKVLPIEISIEEYESIFNFFKVSENNLPKTTMRKGFVDILNGKINPNTTEYKKNEFVLWKEMYHEAHTCCGLLPKDLLDGLEKYQPGYNAEETKEQLNNSKNIQYILDGKRLSSKKYNEYFKKEEKEDPEEQTDPNLFQDDKREDLFYLEGSGYIHNKDNGLFLEQVRGKNSEFYRVLEGNLTLDKLCYESLNNNRILLTGCHGKKCFRTYPLADLLTYLQDYIFYGNKGKDAVKFYIHKIKENIPEYDLSYVLGFNSHWNLPHLEEEKRFQLLTATDKQIEAYNNAKGMIKEYSEDEVEDIKELMRKWISITQMDIIKLSIIIGWSMAAPFRYSFINKFSLFPILCAYGNRSTGKSSILEYFIVHFYKIYENYDATRILFSSARFEDVLSMSSFPIFIQEVNTIPIEVLSLIKEHATGISKYFRKRSARENDFNCLKSAPLSFDCNKLPRALQDPAMNTKLILIQFTELDIIELDPEWNKLRNMLKKTNPFSLMYEHTKDWDSEEVEKRIDFYMTEIIDAIEKAKKKNIEKDNPRIIQQYVIIAFGIDLFNELFETSFERKKVLNILLKSRTIMTQSVLNDFYAFCDEGTMFELDAKNPSYLSHKVENYTSKKKGKGYFFGSANKADFQKFIQEKYSLDELVEKLRDALDDKEKYCISNHNTGKVRGIFIHEDFFDVVKGKGAQRKIP